ncbi:UTRA domain-containing protein [Streptomyces sp. NPDC088725]|uniref:UTRA domain-containing protein n=1 Tax=Streptomyces sp. NPDC088725 TaxID=3365873 RepID=UPI0037FE74F9
MPCVDHPNNDPTPLDFHPGAPEPLSLASYTKGVRRQNRGPGRNLIGLDRFPCPAVLAADAGVRTGEPVWHLERVLLADDERVGLESTYVSVARVPRLGADFEPDSSFYSYLRDVVGVPFGDAVAVKSYTADVISQPQSLTLTTPPGAANVSFRFRCTGSNNWYWVIDGVKVTTK